jgi:hypothetical protein
VSGVPLKEAAAAIEAAITAARERPEEEVSTLANEVVGALDVSPPRAGWTKQAEDFLDTSARRLDDMGDHPQAPLVGSLLGIGYALLAGGENLEMLGAGLAEG